MTRIVVKYAVWDHWNSIHIQKHRVTRSEVEDTITYFVYHKHTYKNRYLVVGRSGSRIISVVIKRVAPNKYYIVTARDADKKERRRLYENEKKQNP